jgi:hypothetical protein
MELLDRAKVNVRICGVELAFNGQLTASSIPDWQQFYNSAMVQTDFSKTYVGLASVAFEESSEELSAGTLYKQKVVFSFPNADGNRSERLALLSRIKFVKLKLSDGRDIVIGRNDYTQNARPKIKIEANIQKGSVSIETVSITPSGFVANASAYQLPAFIPLTLE